MNTFQDVYTELLDWANRSSDELGMVNRAKACINDAVLFANRSHKFKMAERMSTIVYPANAITVDLGVLCDGGTASGISSVQLISSLTEKKGKVIPLLSYNDLQQKRYKNYNTGVQSPSYLSLDRAISDSYGYAAFLLGDKFGLYQTPVSPVSLLVTYNLLFPKLVNDSDTNFFLTHCKDWVISKALQRFNIYLKDDQRIPISDSQIAMDWASLLRWDDELLNHNSIPFSL